MSSYTTPGQSTGGAGSVAPDSKGIPRATSFFGCIFLKQVRRRRRESEGRQGPRGPRGSRAAGHTVA